MSKKQDYLIQWIKVNMNYLKSLFSIFLIFNATLAFSQTDIWNDKATIEYGSHLYNKGEYLAAAHEFQRYIYRNTSDVERMSTWIRAYAKAGKEKIALRELDRWNSQSDYRFSEEYNIEKAWILLKLRKYQAHNEFLKEELAGWKYHNLQHSASIMLQGKWDEAMDFLKDGDTPIEIKLYHLSRQAAEDSYKSPALAGIMSAVVPGTGKFYVGRYLDGAISMLFVGVMSYQATRFFQVQGVESWPGWIYAGLGTAYYSAGIFGSVKAAKEYNGKKIQKYVDETNRLLYSIY